MNESQPSSDRERKCRSGGQAPRRWRSRRPAEQRPERRAATLCAPRISSLGFGSRGRRSTSLITRFPGAESDSTRRCRIVNAVEADLDEGQAAPFDRIAISGGHVPTWPMRSRPTLAETR